MSNDADELHALITGLIAANDEDMARAVLNAGIILSDERRADMITREKYMLRMAHQLMGLKKAAQVLQPGDEHLQQNLSDAFASVAHHTIISFCVRCPLKAADGSINIIAAMLHAEQDKVVLDNDNYHKYAKKSSSDIEAAMHSIVRGERL